MKNETIEANVIIAKCAQAKKPYGIRIEKRKDRVWYCNWAFKISEKSAANEGYDSTVISGKVDLDPEYPGCPYCGGGGWVSCGHCGKLTCWGSGGNNFVCAWCGVASGVREAEHFDLKAGDY